MINDVRRQIAFMVLIAGRKQKPALVAALSQAGGCVTDVMYGRGSVRGSYLRDVFGLVPEESKAMITCLLPNDKVDAMLKILIEKFDFNKPNTGIAFTIPVEKLSFI